VLSLPPAKPHTKSVDPTTEEFAEAVGRHRERLAEF
jgi:hypothetical protein